MDRGGSQDYFRNDSQSKVRGMCYQGHRRTSILMGPLEEGADGRLMEKQTGAKSTGGQRISHLQ